MRYCLIVFLLLLIPIMLRAQDQSIPENDIIILNSNSKLEGELLEVNKRYIYFKVGSVIYTLSKRRVKKIYPKGQKIILVSADIKRLDFEFLDSLKSKEGYIKKEYLKKGFYNISYGNFSINDGGTLGVQNITGYQFNKYLGLGLGIGFVKYNRNDKLIPIFSEIRGYLSSKKVSIYYDLTFGFNAALEPEFDQDGFQFIDCHLVPLDQKTRGGLFFHPAIGCKFGSDEAAFVIDLGIHVANTNTITDSDFTERQEGKRKFQRVVLRLGIML